MFKPIPIFCIASYYRMERKATAIEIVEITTHGNVAERDYNDKTIPL